MSAGLWIQFQSLWMLLGSGVIAVVIAGIAIRRRLGLPRISAVLAAGGLVLLCLGAGGVALKCSKSATVVVMVDLSPSTRGAQYRETGYVKQKVEHLMGKPPGRVVYFSDHNLEGTLDRPPGQMGASRTVFTPPTGVDAVVLFSDGQFDLPAVMPRVFAVVDPMLDEPADAAVVDLEQHGEQVLIGARVRGKPRVLRVESGERVSERTISPPGMGVVVSMASRGSTELSARFEGMDLWPENDGAGMIPSREVGERWWVGVGAPTGWRELPAEGLPADAGSYLRPAVIVLNNIAAGQLTELVQQRLEQYVRDLGGGLVIAGGDRAFAAGGYGGSRLEVLSPLSSYAPGATVHWVILADSSGSMAGRVDGRTRWDIAREAMQDLVGRLPPEDLLSVGSFSDQVVWWSKGKKVKETGRPEKDVSPHGPTNLSAALEQVIREADGGLPEQLLLMTDGQAPPPDEEKLVAQLKKADIHLNLLAIGQGEAMGVLRRAALRTGGSVVEEFDPGRWVGSAGEWLRGAMAREMEHGQVRMQWIGPGRWANQNLGAWNRTWLKAGANLWGLAEREEDRIPLVAQWQVGLGKVASMAFAAMAEDVEEVAKQVAQPPKDPVWQVDWKMGGKMDVIVESAGGSFINDAKLMLRMVMPDGQGDERLIPIPQTAPGRYELSLEPPRSPVYATVEMDGRVLDRRALAGRYAEEFSAIGNNMAKLHELAERSGGRVIGPGDHQRLNLTGPARVRPLRSLLISIGAIMLMVAAVLWRRRWIMS